MNTNTNEAERMKRYQEDKLQWLEHQTEILRV